jgi:succinate-acetate transporter protein
MAVGNTFGATALSSYGGFWLSFAIILTPGGFQIASTLEADGPAPFYNSFGLYLMGWFIFTTILLVCTLRSTVAFFSLFFTLDLAFMLLGIGYLRADAAGPNSACIKAGGYFGLFAAFLAWYNALAGIADSSNRMVFLITSTIYPFANSYKLLRHPRCALPMVREGSRTPRQGRRLLRRAHRINIPQPLRPELSTLPISPVRAQDSERRTDETIPPREERLAKRIIGGGPAWPAYCILFNTITIFFLVPSSRSLCVRDRRALWCWVVTSHLRSTSARRRAAEPLAIPRIQPALTPTSLMRAPRS